MGNNSGPEKRSRERDDLVAGEPVREYGLHLIEDRLSKARRRRQEVEEEIGRRRGLSYRFLQEIDDEISDFRLHLSQFKFWGLGYNTGVDMRRNQLERLLFAAVERRRREELRAWGDVAGLRREVQEAMKEYESLLRLQKAVERKG